MSYDRETYEKVENRLYEMRLKAADDLEKKKQVFYSRFPRAKEIEKSLGLMSVGIAKAVLKGRDVKEALESLKKESEKLKEELAEIILRAELPKNYLEPDFACKLCNDEGFIDGKMCVCMKNLLKKESYKKLSDMAPVSGCSFRGFSLDYYPDEGKPSPKKRMRNILNYCSDYAKNFGKNSKNLLFMGKTGLGKTHLSMAIASEVVSKGFSVIYTSAHNMTASMEKERFKSSGSEVFESRSYFLDCDLLIIDDLGTEFSTGFSSSAIYDIINSRLILRRPVIISTNLSAYEFEEKYTPQITSRVFGCYDKLEFLGQDIRPKLRLNPAK